MQKQLPLISVVILSLVFCSNSLAWEEGACTQEWQPQYETLGEAALEGYHQCMANIYRSTVSVPEIDTLGSIGAISLIAALLGLVRETRRQS